MTTHSWGGNCINCLPLTLWAGFYACFSAHWGSTVVFVLLLYPSGVVLHPKDLQVSQHDYLKSFQLSPHHCFITGFMCGFVFVAHYDSWTSKKTST